MPLRYYRTRDTETVNLVPIAPPSLVPRFDVTPKNNIPFSYTNDFGTYTYPHRVASYNAFIETVPGMFTHAANTTLTFTGNLLASVISPTIIEWFWIFGDGNEAVGQIVTHKYKYPTPGTIAHLRVTDQDGNVAYASMNMLLTA